MQSEPLTRTHRVGRSLRVPAFELSARWRWILFAAVLAACSIRYLARAEVVLDDAFIYLDLARNWVAGHGPRFNPGDRHLPASGPAWIMLLAAARTVLPGISWESLGLLLTFVCLVAAAVPLHLLLAPRHPLAAAMAPIAIFCAPSILGLCGHDTSLPTAAGLWLLQARRAQRWGALAPLAALFYLGRAEGAALGVAVLASAVLARGWRVRDMGQQLRAMAGGILAGVLLVALWHVYFYAEFGAILPSTLAAKLAHGRAGWTSFAAALPDAFRTSLGNPWLAVPGLLALALDAPGLVAWAALHCSLLSLSGIAAYHWYFYPLELVLLTANLVGLDLAAGLLASLWRASAARGLARTLTAVVAVATLAGAYLLHTGQDATVESMRARRETYRDASAWMSEQVRRQPPGHEGRPLLLTDEVGALAFYLPEFEVRDTVGLALPVSDPAEVGDVARAVERTQPDFLLLPGRTDRTELLLVGEDGWQVFPLAYRPLPGMAGRYVMFGAAEKLPQRDPRRRLVDLARLTRQPLRVTGQLIPLEVPEVGTCLSAHAPSLLGFDLDGQPAQRMLIGFGLDDASWQGAAATDGAQFAVDAVAADGRAERVFTVILRPLTEPADRGVHAATVALPDGTRALRLSTENAGGVQWDWTYWASVTPR